MEQIRQLFSFKVVAGAMGSTLKMLPMIVTIELKLILALLSLQVRLGIKVIDSLETLNLT